jgi:hypothetical protein
MCSRKSETGLSGSGAEGYIHRLIPLSPSNASTL